MRSVFLIVSEFISFCGEVKPLKREDMKNAKEDCAYFLYYSLYSSHLRGKMSFLYIHKDMQRFSYFSPVNNLTPSPR